MKTVKLRPDFAEALAGQDPFEWARTVQGQEFRHKEGRRTLRFELAGRAWFLKYHGGIGWKEIVKNFSRAKLPVLGARLEWEAIHHLRTLGIETMVPVAFGESGNNPAKQESFVVTEALDHHISLEDYCKQWTQTPPPTGLKRALIQRVAQMAQALHQHGLNHCDFYICHFLLDEQALESESKHSHPVWEHAIHLHLIDLHRMKKRRRVPKRWLKKDLVALCYSALDCGLTKRDYLRFLSVYENQPWRTILARDSKYWTKVVDSAAKLYFKAFKTHYDTKQVKLMG